MWNKKQTNEKKLNTMEMYFFVAIKATLCQNNNKSQR